MITALDHIVLVCPDIEAGMSDYTDVFGVGPVWQAEANGVATAVFKLGNTALELMAPTGDSEVANKLRKMTEDGPHLASLAYQTDQIDETHRSLTRRGLHPSEITGGRSEDKETGAVRTWRRFRVNDTAMAGVRTFVLELGGAILTPHKATPGSVTALDHIVINTPNPDRTVANYGARLGLRFALDRTAEQWNTRFLFFRVGNLTVEIIHQLNKDQNPSDPDNIWGMTWAVDDLEAAHKRLQVIGRDISEIREGRKPGSRVFTLRDGTLGVPTLFISHASS